MLLGNVRCPTVISSSVLVLQTPYIAAVKVTGIEGNSVMSARQTGFCPTYHICHVERVRQVSFELQSWFIANGEHVL